jgi:hypothetical protein
MHTNSAAQVTFLKKFIVFLCIQRGFTAGETDNLSRTIGYLVRFDIVPEIKWLSLAGANLSASKTIRLLAAFTSLKELDLRDTCITWYVFALSMILTVFSI